jgi:hypothetical protein
MSRDVAQVVPWRHSTNAQPFIENTVAAASPLEARKTAVWIVRVYQLGF